MASSESSSLCLECGLCCNGVIFARGRLQPGDDPAALARLGLALSPVRNSKTRPPGFRQPCAALEGCHCRIYKDRPRYCREFECALLKRVLSGDAEPGAALRVIRRALRRADKVKRLLRKLGEVDEQAALTLRIRRVRRRFESGEADREAAGLYGELTLAVHDLQLLLSREFYPG